MSHRVAEHPEALSPAWQPPRAERKHLRLGLIEVAHPHVEVQLLRMPRVRPLRRPQARHPERRGA